MPPVPPGAACLVILSHRNDRLDSEDLRASAALVGTRRPKRAATPGAGRKTRLGDEAQRPTCFLSSGYGFANSIRLMKALKDKRTLPHEVRNTC
ncbi:Protein of unknown function, partial [Gryllus bimaculatus]